MANSTWWIMLFSGLSLILIAVSTFLLGWTLRLTRKANDAAFRAANAAETSTANTLNLGRIQTIGYISVESAQIVNFEVKRTPNALIKLKNFGNSPSTEIKIDFHIGIIADKTQIPKPQDSDILTENICPVLHAQDHFNIETNFGFELNPIQFHKFNTDQLRIHVYGTIKYLDVFGDDQIVPLRLISVGGSFDDNVISFTDYYQEIKKSSHKL